MANTLAYDAVMGAISASTQRNEIVTLTVPLESDGAPLREVLDEHADDGVDVNHGLTEYWGENEDGPWRVHVRVTGAHS